VKKVGKSVNICRSYGLLSRGSFFYETVYLITATYWAISQNLLNLRSQNVAHIIILRHLSLMTISSPKVQGSKLHGSKLSECMFMRADPSPRASLGAVRELVPVTLESGPIKTNMIIYNGIILSIIIASDRGDLTLSILNYLLSDRRSKLGKYSVRSG